MSGFFISFEGPEGAGKTTQIARLLERLKQEKQEFIHTREPGGTPFGQRIREVVLNPDLEIFSLAEFLAYSSSRAQLVEAVIQPALAKGEIVVCDRYADSSLAYQGAGRGLAIEDLQTITAIVTGGLKPHLTFLLDIDPEIGLKRAAIRGQPDRLEKADLAFHQRVREGFLQLAKAEPERFVVLDALKSPDELSELIWGEYQKHWAMGGGL